MPSLIEWWRNPYILFKQYLARCHNNFNRLSQSPPWKTPDCSTCRQVYNFDLLHSHLTEYRLLLVIHNTVNIRLISLPSLKNGVEW